MNRKTSISAAAVLSAIALQWVLVAPAQAQVKAALTRDVDRPSAQPVNGNCFTFTNSLGITQCRLYTVPAGKRLIVETVGYQGTVASGAVVYQVLFGQDSGFANVILGSTNVFPVTPVLAYDTGGTRAYNASQALKIYLDETQILVGGLYRNGSVSYQQYFNFSGYLVDK